MHGLQLITQCMHIWGESLPWINIMLRNRKQGGESFGIIATGYVRLSQGFKVELELLSIFINNSEKNVSSRMAQFACDSNFCFSVKSTEDHEEIAGQQIKFNMGKCKVMQTGWKTMNVRCK